MLAEHLENDLCMHRSGKPAPEILTLLEEIEKAGEAHNFYKVYP